MDEQIGDNKEESEDTVLNNQQGRGIKAASDQDNIVFKSEDYTGNTDNASEIMSIEVSITAGMALGLLLALLFFLYKRHHDGTKAFNNDPVVETTECDDNTSHSASKLLVTPVDEVAMLSAPHQTENLTPNSPQQELTQKEMDSFFDVSNLSIVITPILTNSAFTASSSIPTSIEEEDDIFLKEGSCFSEFFYDDEGSNELVNPGCNEVRITDP